MTQSSTNSWNWNSILIYFRKLGIDAINWAILAFFLTTTYKTLGSIDYWDFLTGKIIDLFQIFKVLITHSLSYFLANLTVLFVIFLLFKIFKPKSWIDKVKYNQKEHLNFYIAELLKKSTKVKTKEDYLNFCQDTVERLHNIFIHKSSINSATWLKPDGDRLVLFRSNKNSKYDIDNNHYAFTPEEGVVGNSWNTGKLDLYSEKQENRLYLNREPCGDKSYICCPIVDKPLNPYGIIAVGTSQNIYWEEEDKETLKLICAVIFTIINNLNDEIKTELNL